MRTAVIVNVIGVCCCMYSTHQMKLLIALALLAYSVESKSLFGSGTSSFKKLINSNSGLPKVSFSDIFAKSAGGPWQAALRTAGSSSLQRIPPGVQAFGIISVAVGVLSLWINKILWTPSRKYDQASNSVGKEYDAWEQEGILEHYWGEHIHLGYYEEPVRRKGIFSNLPPRKNFIQAKLDFIEEMLRFGRMHPDQLQQEKELRQARHAQLQLDSNSSVSLPDSTLKILDVGCGIGGTSRFLAKKFGDSASVVGITLSGNQAKRATALAQQQGVYNAEFRVMDALAMDFPDDSFDLVWACESGEHMPDKKRYVEEMTRVLKPGGRIVVATWCQRDENGRPFDKKERRMLDFLYSEWTHPHFISIADYARLMQGTGRLQEVATADWTPQTLPSWLHSIWVGVFDPWPVFSQPRLYWKCFRDGLTLVRMHKSFQSKLMHYGMMTAKKSDRLCN